jgi:tetratricopeptide (TPR) repeat protein
VTAGPIVWTPELVEARLRGLDVRGRPPPAVHAAYREAAAVLAWFDPGAIRPSGASAPAQAPPPAFLAECVATPSPSAGARWVLLTEIRRQALAELLARGAFEAALAANPERPDEPLQRMLEAHLRRAAPPVEQQSLPDLVATLQVVDWLEGVMEGLPPRERIQARLAREDLLRPLRRLSGEHFQGRASELARLRRHLGLEPSPEPVSRAPLVLRAAGGMGKSSLLARLVLDYADIAAAAQWPFAYLDFDLPSLRVEEPLSLLVEILRQLGTQFPALRPSCDRMCEQVSLSLAPPEARGTTSSTWDRLTSIASLGLVLHEGKLGGRPYLVVLDTFEEVQYASRAFIGELLSFLEVLARTVPELRVVFAGRSPIEGLGENEIVLEDLDEGSAAALLASLGVTRPATQRAVVFHLGGNPLSLWLAAEIIKREKLDERGVVDVIGRAELFSRVRDARIQGQLYDRLLGHVHDEDVRQLAHPGLLLRVITTDIIVQVLAGPCGVTVPDAPRAEALFEGLAREALVTREGDELHHRADVRRVMLDLIRHDRPDVVEAVHRAAVAYHAPRPSPRDRAEAIYHRLCLGEPEAIDDADWNEVKPFFTRATVDEVPPEQRAYLTTRLGFDLDERARQEADLGVWERDAEKRVRELMRIGRVEKIEEALAVLRERKERTPRSPLLRLEAEALLRTDRWDEAGRVAAAALAEIPSGTDDEDRLGLLLLQADIAARKEDAEAELKALDEAVPLVAPDDPARYVEIGLRRLAALRERQVELERERDAVADLVAKLGEIPDQAIVDNRGAYQALAAEVERDFPEVRERFDRLFPGGAPEQVDGRGHVEHLTGRAFQRLHYALLSAFPTPDALSRMVLEGMNTPLTHISRGGSLRDAVFELVKWAQEQGRVFELVDVARRENPGNPDLLAFAEAIGAVEAAAPLRRLSHDEVLQLHAAAVEVGLPEARSALLSGIDYEFVAGLVVGPNPVAQLLLDLDTMNRSGHLADGSDPLAFWLKNAIALTRFRPEGRTFEQALETITGRKRPERSPR